MFGSQYTEVMSYGTCQSMGNAIDDHLRKYMVSVAHIYVGNLLAIMKSVGVAPGMNLMEYFYRTCVSA